MSEAGNQIILRSVVKDYFITAADGKCYKVIYYVFENELKRKGDGK